MFFTVTFDLLILAWFLSRQLRVRPVPRILRMGVPLFLGAIGLVEFLSYRGSHHITPTSYWWLLGSLVVGAGLLGALRALTVKLWTVNNWVVRQGTWLTIALWLVSLAVHFVVAGTQHNEAGNLEVDTLLLYLALTYGVQRYVVHRRATPLWNALGPEAGRRFGINFGSGPGGAGAFFTAFRNGGAGFGESGAGFGQTPSDDPTIIDAEVVEDDELPRELHRPD
jgi:hypothetical protein